MSLVFISHSDAVAAIELEDVLREAFPGELEIFNTSRSSSGLAPGESIDSGVLRHIREAEIIIWLASPSSVAHSFWMAWELGAATAYERRLIPARCLGLQPSQLPLLQGGRMAPDIGTEAGMRQLLTQLQESLRPSSDKIKATLRSRFEELERPNRLWGMEAPSQIRLRVLGRRILVENQSSLALDFRTESSEGTSLLADLCVDPLGALEPRERRIMDLRSGVQPPRLHKDILLKWGTSQNGRFWADVPVQGE